VIREMQFPVYESRFAISNLKFQMKLFEGCDFRFRNSISFGLDSGCMPPGVLVKKFFEHAAELAVHSKLG